MDQYGFNETDFRKPLGELTEILQQVWEGEKKRNNFSVVSVDLDYHLSGLYNFSRAVVLNQNGGEAQLLFENESYIKFLKDIFLCKKMGYINTELEEINLYHTEDFFLKVVFNVGLPTELPQMGMYMDSDGNVADREDIIEIIWDGFEYYGNHMSFANCVPLQAEHPEYSFDFLKKIYTDKKLSNLFLYGIEGNHYELINGKVNTNHHFPKLLIGNNYLSHPASYEYPNKGKIYYDIHKNRKTSAYAPYMFKKDSLEQEIFQTDVVLMDNLPRFLLSESDNFDALIDDIKSLLYQNGAQKIIDEVNRQLDGMK